MFLLDTNVISELRKANSGKIDGNVQDWAISTNPVDLFLSVITILELETEILQKQRKDPEQGSGLRAWLESQVLPAFRGRILDVTLPVVQKCARLHVPDRRSERDALIAATAAIHNLTVVTRNVSDFEGTGTEVLNPWD